MGITFSSLSHATHAEVKRASNSPLTAAAFPLGHVHQALAAALGYNTHAALKAAMQVGDESLNYDSARHVIIDVIRLKQRLSVLNDALSFDVVLSAIRQAFESLLPETKLYDSATDLLDAISAEVVDAIESSEGYSAEIAMTNAYGGDFDIEFNESTPIDTAQGQWTLEISGTSSLEQDPEKAFHGTTIDVYAEVVFEKIGRRVLGEMSVTEAGGRLQDLATEDDPFGFDPDLQRGNAA